MSSIDRNTYDSWIRRPPSETFDLMEMTGSVETILPRICRTIVSFLNTSGGLVIVVLPKDSFGPSFEASVYAAIDSEIVPRPSVEAKVVRTFSQDYPPPPEILVVDVPVGYERPYSHKHQILVREGQSIQIASRPKVLALIGEHEDPDVRWERQLMGNVTEADLDGEKIQECMMRVEVSAPMHNWRFHNDDPLPWPLLRYFNLGMRPLVRNSAIVLFGKAPTTYFPQTAIRAVAYYSEEAHARDIEDEKTFSRNVFDNIEGCFAFLERHLPVSSRFPTLDDQSFQREPANRVPFLALREAVLNAIVHRDFSKFDCNVVIKVSPEQLEIWNPGCFPPGTDLNKLEEFRVSRPPNPDIAQVLQRTGYIERLGSGINRIIKAFESVGLPRPKWEEVGGGVRLTLTFGEASKSSIHRLAQAVAGQLEFGEVLSARRLAAIAGLEGDQIAPVIEYLCERGTLVPVEEDRFKVVNRSRRRP